MRSRVLTWAGAWALAAIVAAYLVQKVLVKALDIASGTAVGVWFVVTVLLAWAFRLLIERERER